MPSWSRCNSLEAGRQLLAAGPHVLEEGRLAHDLDRRQRRRATHRVAAVRAAVAALRPLVVELAARAERGERETRAMPFAMQMMSGSMP